MARRRAARRRDGRDPRQGRALRRKYRRIKARSGHKIAIGAIKHAILIAFYHMLKNASSTAPPIVHPDAERKQRERTTKRLIARLERFGHSVTLQPTATTTATPEAVAAP